MTRKALLGSLVLAFVCSFSAFASHPDGVVLLVAYGPAPEAVTLDWTGGQPGFHVYRSTSPVLLVQAANLLGDTPIRTWTDTPPAGTIFFYEATSDCVYGPPEVCDGLDNDCDGTVDNNLTDPWLGQACCPTGNLADCTNTGTGTRCATGVSVCSSGAQVCSGAVAKSAELCNGIDDDCEGVVDNAPTDVGGACATNCPGGLLANCIGECRAGTFVCSLGTRVCSGSVGPSPEVCDSLDNDCDGTADEGAGCSPLGAPCAYPLDCGSGFCADGVCCESACAGACRSCGQPGLAGTCAPYARGTDPQMECGEFTCDGSGACATTCASDGDCAATHVCETDMTCRPRCLANADCAGGYACRVDGHCQPYCAADSDCTAGFFCDVSKGQCQNANLLAARVSPGGVLLGTDLPIVVEPYHQGSPAVAFDGTNYLVAWIDTRDNPGGDVFVARYGPDGVAVGPGPVQVESKPGPIQSPAVAFNGTNFLVVWAQGGPGGQYDVHGARVAPTGAVLDLSPIPIATGMADEIEPAVASDGASFLVVWSDSRAASPGIYGTRVTESGLVLDAGGIPVWIQPGPVGGPAVAYDGMTYLLVWAWDEDLGDPDVYGARLSPSSGMVLDPPIPISAGPAKESEPAVASDGTGFVVTWTDARSGKDDIYGARVDAAGTVLDSLGVELLSDSQAWARSALILSNWDVTDWALVAMGNDDPSGGLSGDFRIGLVLLDTAGGTFTPLPPGSFPVTTGPNARHNPAVGSDATGYFVVWEDHRPRPGPTGNGGTCALNADCASGSCVDGVCCDRACSLPNADSSCSTGTCALLSCHPGFGDCNGNPRDGCETDVTADLGHCGACGAACDDASACTNDLCVAGACRNVDRTRCATPVCGFAASFPGCANPDSDGDGLGDTWEEARAIDLDCNSVYDASDVTIPEAHKHVKDVYLKLSWMENSATETLPGLHRPSDESISRIKAAFGASHLTTTPERCDGVSPTCSPGLTCSSADFVCLPACTTDTDCATGKCVEGQCRLRRLHLDLTGINSIPHTSVLSYGSVQPGCIAGGDASQGVNFYDLKADPANFNPKTALFMRYGVFGHMVNCDSADTCASPACTVIDGSRPTYGNSGIAEITGNDMIIALGAYPVPLTAAEKVRRESGTAMHELGHTLGLRHGGRDCDPTTDPLCVDPDLNRKVNYISVMNHLYNFGIPVAALPGSVTPDPSRTRLDFSHAALPPLSEAALDEPAGLQPGSPAPHEADLVKYFNPQLDGLTRFGSTAAGQPINWRADDPIVSGPVQVDLNKTGLLETYAGAEDWSNLKYAFQCDAKFLDGATPPPGTLATNEITVAIAIEVDELHPLQDVRLDVEPECLDITSNGVIPVTVFGSATFNVQEVDLSTVRLSGAIPVSVSFSDKNGDGYLDLKGQFRQSEMVLMPGSVAAVLGGKLTSGPSFQGEDAIRLTSFDSVTDCGGCGMACSANHNTATCVSGVCGGTCDPGFADCDGDKRGNGCEVDTHVAQSTSPSYYSLGMDRDLQAGYMRVGGITNCGACGESCDDGNSCTTDLCVPVGASGAQVGVCRQFGRAQCSEARCRGPLPAGTPPPLEPACQGGDADGDGLPAAWESAQVDPYTNMTNGAAGVDLNCNGVIGDADGDLVWHDPPAGEAAPDIYLEYDYMAPAAGETGSHAPPSEAVAAVVAAFADQGIALHVDPTHQALPHADVVYLPVTSADPCPGLPGSVSLHDAAYKGNPVNFDPRRRLGYHYGLFGHQSCSQLGATDASGVAEVRGNDFIVSFAPFTYSGTPAEVASQRVREMAGTLMHELGHNLGLRHGGADDPAAPTPGADVNQKPNHISVMNHSYQLPGIERAATEGTISPLDPVVPWRVDFSHGFEIAALDEGGGLDENLGIDIPVPLPESRDIARYFCGSPAGVRAGPGTGPIDWNCDGLRETGVSGDLNNSGGPAEILTVANDWSSLYFKFQCQPTLADGAVPPAFVAGNELTFARAQSEGLRAGGTVCDAAHADCDGDRANGCEVALGSDPDHCGGCGLSCSSLNMAARTCAGGSCSGTCATGFADCNADKRADGCEANLSLEGNCGGCGNTCAAQFCTLGSTCTAGSCAGGAARDCDDGLACTADACDEQNDRCAYECRIVECWLVDLVAAGPATGITWDTAFVPAGSSTYVAKGTTLYAIRNSTEGSNPAGSVRWQTAFSTTLNNFPSPVPLSDGSGLFLFVGAEDGSLYKVRTGDGGIEWSKETRRPTCAADRLTATPAIQLYGFSDAAFRSAQDARGHANDDLVFVITRAECGSTTDNRMFAIDASSGSTAWTFNDDRTHMMDYASEGCALDYTTNTLYCGTNLPDGRAQNTLWAVDTTSGTVRWSGNAGSIQNRPVLKTTSSPRLYVANAQGAVMAYDPAGNGAGGMAPLWSTPLALPAGVTRNIWAEFRADTGRMHIVVVDSSGLIHHVSEPQYDPEGFLDWTGSAGPGLQYVTAPTAAPTSGKLYVGRSDGTVLQLNLLDGSVDNSVAVGPGPAYDPTLDQEGATPDRLTVASGATGGVLKNYCVPWGSDPTGLCSADADCAAMATECAAASCDQATGACVLVPRPAGAPCDDGRACSTGDACLAGVCHDADHSVCPCTATGDRACAADLTCCGAATGGASCSDLQGDRQNCGACGHACALGQACVQGACVRDTSVCSGGLTDAATLTGLGPALAGATGITYDRTAANACNAIVPTYRTPPVPSAAVGVDPMGGATYWINPDPQGTPLGAYCDMTSDGGGWTMCMAIHRPDPFFDLPGLMVTDASTGFSQIVLQGARTSSTTPFFEQRFNQGPVGPVVDRQFHQMTGQVQAYVANWRNNGDLYVLTRQCDPCPWFERPLLAWPPITPQRITALAFGARTDATHSSHRYLYVAHGTTLSFLDVDSGALDSINLANPGVYNGAAGGGSVDRILSLAADPLYGDVYLEVKDAAGQSEILVMRGDDESVRNLAHCAADLRLPVAVPPLLAGDGRLSLSSQIRLIRLLLQPIPDDNQPEFFDHDPIP